MELTPKKIEEFKAFLESSTNDDVYYLLKDWLHYELDADDDFDKAMDYFVNNLHGSLRWID